MNIIFNFCVFNSDTKSVIDTIVVIVIILLFYDFIYLIIRLSQKELTKKKRNQKRNLIVLNQMFLRIKNQQIIVNLNSQQIHLKMKQLWSPKYRNSRLKRINWLVCLIKHMIKFKSIRILYRNLKQKWTTISNEGKMKALGVINQQLILPRRLNLCLLRLFLKIITSTKITVSIMIIIIPTMNI